MANALALRLRAVSKYVVRQEQTGFVQGMFIFYTLFFAWEAMEWVGETGQQCFMLNIYFDKAYDWVDWSLPSKGQALRTF